MILLRMSCTGLRKLSDDIKLHRYTVTSAERDSAVTSVAIKAINHAITRCGNTWTGDNTDDIHTCTQTHPFEACRDDVWAVAT